MKSIGQIIVSLLILIMGGYVLSLLWSWFIVPLGVSGISMVQAMGINLIAYFVKGAKSSNPEQLDKTLIERLSVIIAAFVMGYFIHLFM